MFFLFVIIGMFILRKRKLVDKTDNEVYLKEIERNLKVLRGEIISKETLETQLGVLNQSYETNKTNRSILIRKLNGRGKVKIERLRKKEDKRFFNYKISWINLDSEDGNEIAPIKNNQLPWSNLWRVRGVFSNLTVFFDIELI